jgi:hypothetical protein
MYSITIREALETLPGTGDHFLYLYRDGEIVFYVGRSIDPIERLEQHLGTLGGNSFFKDRDLPGNVIRKNYPESLNWLIDLFTLKDCQPFIGKNSPLPAWMNKRDCKTYKRLLKSLEVGGFSYDKYAMEMAEQALINNYHPCLNARGTNHFTSDLPKKYRDPRCLLYFGEDDGGPDKIIEEIIGTKRAVFQHFDVNFDVN